VFSLHVLRITTNSCAGACCTSAWSTTLSACVKKLQEMYIYMVRMHGGFGTVVPPCNCVDWCVLERGGVEFAIDGQSASMSLFRADLWGPCPDFTCSLVWHVLASSCRAPSLTRGPVCILQCTSLTGQSREGPITIYCYLIWDSPDLEDQVPASISPGTGWPS
jgi:hypothetical protein